MMTKHMDHREYSYYPEEIKEKGHHTLSILNYDTDEYEDYPAHYIVCPSCQGRGSYVNPSIDSHGISAEEFYEDPDFAEDYCSGRYDVSCKSCGGNRVILYPSTPEGEEKVKEILKSEAESRAEIEAERRMGC